MPAVGVLTVLSVFAASAFILRLGGFAPRTLPGAGPLAVILGLLLALRHLQSSRPIALRRFLITHRFALGVTCLAVLAVLTRLPGLSADLGHTPIDVDEGRLAASVQHFFVTGNLAHETVEHYPGVVFWLFAGAAFVDYVRELASGLTLAPADLSLDLFVRAARFTNVLVGASIVTATALTGRRLFGARAGLVAALVVTVVPLSVDTTTLMRNDPGMVLAVLGAVHLALVSLDDPRRGWVLGAGLLAGTATGIKYSSLFVLAPVVLAASARGTMPERAIRASLALGGFVAAVGITNHFVWADVPTFMKQLADQVAITGGRHWSATKNPAAFYVTVLDRFGPGWPLVVLAAGFAVHGLSGRQLRPFVFLAFPVLYMWFMTQRPAQFPRWVFPMVPFVAIAGAGVALMAGRVAAWLPMLAPERRGWVRRAATVLVVAGALWLPLSGALVATSRRLTPPTHVLAERWLRSHAAPGSVVLLESHWLAPDAPPVAVRRVPDLKITLDGGVDALAGTHWLVVPEPLFGHPTLRDLGLVAQIKAGQGFGGHLGYDYEIYAVPRLPGAAAR